MPCRRRLRARRPRTAATSTFTRIWAQTGTPAKELTAEELLRWMDADDIAQAVVLPLVSPESSSYLITHRFRARRDQTASRPTDSLLRIDPRTSYSGGHAGLVTMLKRYVDAGATASASTSRA